MLKDIGASAPTQLSITARTDSVIPKLLKLVSKMQFSSSFAYQEHIRLSTSLFNPLKYEF